MLLVEKANKNNTIKEFFHEYHLHFHSNIYFKEHGLYELFHTFFSSHYHLDLIIKLA